MGLFLKLIGIVSGSIFLGCAYYFNDAIFLILGLINFGIALISDSN